MNYQCFNDEPPPNFLMAYRMAGETIERMAENLLTGPKDKAPYFRWLVMRPQMLFAHLVFAYRNQVFAVYVNVVDDGIPSFSTTHKKRLIEAAEEFNLVQLAPGLAPHDTVGHGSCDRIVHHVK